MEDTGTLFTRVYEDRTDNEEGSSIVSEMVYARESWINELTMRSAEGIGERCLNKGRKLDNGQELCSYVKSRNPLDCQNCGNVKMPGRALLDIRLQRLC